MVTNNRYDLALMSCGNNGVGGFKFIEKFDYKTSITETLMGYVYFIRKDIFLFRVDNLIGKENKIVVYIVDFDELSQKGLLHRFCSPSNLKLLAYEESGKVAEFTMGIGENNFDEIYYMDNDDIKDCILKILNEAVTFSNKLKAEEIASDEEKLKEKKNEILAVFNNYYNKIK